MSPHFLYGASHTGLLLTTRHPRGGGGGVLGPTPPTHPPPPDPPTHTPHPPWKKIGPKFCFGAFGVIDPCSRRPCTLSCIPWSAVVTSVCLLYLGPCTTCLTLPFHGSQKMDTMRQGQSQFCWLTVTVAGRTSGYTQCLIIVQQ